MFFHPKNILGTPPFFPYLNIRTISITTSGISSFSGFRTLNVSSVIKNPTRLRNEVIFWAISANLTDLLMTDQDFLDNLMEANIKPDALTSDDLLKFVVNPKNTICQSDLPTKIIVSEKISSSDIQVNFHFWIFSTFSTFFSILLVSALSASSSVRVKKIVYKSANNFEKWPKLLVYVKIID